MQLTFDTDRLSSWERLALISWLVQRLSDSSRRELSRDLPEIYNKLCGVRVVEVREIRLEPGPIPTPSGGLVGR